MLVFIPRTKNLFVSVAAAATAAKLLQLCPTLCDPIDSSSPGFPLPGILQARTLEWVAISFSILSLLLDVKMRKKRRNLEINRRGSLYVPKKGS